MRMLESQDDETDVEVTWEDQDRINTFSKLNARLSDLEESLELKKQEREALEDLSTELELGDEDELVLYKVGESFAHIPLSEAQERLQQDQEALQKELDEIQERVEECENTMKELKVLLYGKFGKAINLEA